MKYILIKIISFYQKYLSFLKKPSCVFYPSCSEYTKESIRKHGVVEGLYMGVGRILRCHPWQKNHIDLVK
ncbi:MAG: membrane protein insertion efficiency factor YidD [bacterium]